MFEPVPNGFKCAFFNAVAARPGCVICVAGGVGQRGPAALLKIIPFSRRK
jgi:hypothetical protein